MSASDVPWTSSALLLPASDRPRARDTSREQGHRSSLGGPAICGTPPALRKGMAPRAFWRQGFERRSTRDRLAPGAPTDVATAWRRMGRGIEHIVGADVHPGEWRVVLLLFANLFLLLTAYYILKVIREPLILLGGGAVKRSYARGLQAVVLSLIIPTYSVLANRVEPDRLVKWVLGFFGACLVAFFFLGHAGVPLGFAFFVWLGIFSTLSIAQFWSLANDLLSEAEGKRLFPLVAAGGTLGGIVGAQVAARALSWLDPYQLMLVAAGVVAVCVGLTHWLHRERMGRFAAALLPTADLEVRHERDRRGGFTLVFHDRYLLLIAIAVFLLNLINTTGDFVLARLIDARAASLAVHAVNAARIRQKYIGTFYGDFQTWVSALTAVTQIFLVARLWKRIGLGRSLLILPVVAMAGYGVAAFLPALAFVAVLKVVENSTDYSLQNTIQHALFLSTSRDAKYKAKAAIDTLAVRLGDLGSTALVFLGALLALDIRAFAVANFVAAVVWLVVVRRLAARVGPLASPPRPRSSPGPTS